jgi:pantetheine-phosphate adenylyltransferase
VKALYPGSFDPWHEGHENILQKAKKVFDVVDVLTITKDIGLLSTWLKDKDYQVIIRGIRNSNDLEFEKSVQYWYEDLGITLPIVYFICDRKLVHISSSAIRSMEGLK